MWMRVSPTTFETSAAETIDVLWRVDRDPSSFMPSSWCTFFWISLCIVIAIIVSTLFTYHFLLTCTQLPAAGIEMYHYSVDCWGVQLSSRHWPGRYCGKRDTTLGSSLSSTLSIWYPVKILFSSGLHLCSWLFWRSTLYISSTWLLTCELLIATSFTRNEIKVVVNR